ncbi:hypothetical protein [Streptomyces sp. NPDC052107]|uniref:hypothetical protein n=1 Tax=Streptomyces sp. NPDC052107 TaxID=3155632 RepID=UPI003439F914
MELAKRFVTISATATAAILFSAGGAQAQTIAGHGDDGKQTSTNTNSGGGPNNNNGYPPVQSGSTQTKALDAQAPECATGTLEPLCRSLINFQVCYPKGQDGSISTLSGNQNHNCHQS